MSIKEIMDKYNLTMRQLADRFNIPYRTVQNWCAEGGNHRECPEYVIGMIAELLGNK